MYFEAVSIWQRILTMSIAPISAGGNLQSITNSNSGVFGGDAASTFGALFAMLFKGMPMEVAAVEAGVNAETAMFAQKSEGPLNVLSFLNDSPIPENTENFEAALAAAAAGEVKVEVLVSELRAVVKELRVSGADMTSLVGVEELTEAYIKMGMDPEEAKEKAERVVAALEVMKQRLGIESNMEEGHSLEEQMLQMFMQAAAGANPSQNQMTMAEYKVHVQQAMVKFESTTIIGSQDVAMKVMAGDTLIEQPALAGDRLSARIAEIGVNAKANADNAAAEKVIADKLINEGAKVGEVIANAANATKQVQPIPAEAIAKVSASTKDIPVTVEEIIKVAQSKNAEHVAIKEVVEKVQNEAKAAPKVEQVVANHADKVMAKAAPAEVVAADVATKEVATAQHSERSAKENGFLERAPIEVGGNKPLFQWKPSNISNPANSFEQSVLSSISGEELTSEDVSEMIDEVAEEILNVRNIQHSKVAVERSSMQSMAR